MGALPLPNVNTPPDRRKPVVKAQNAKAAKRGKCAPRSREDIDSEFRSGSNYEQWTGWTPVPRVASSDFRRLAAGALSYDLRDYLFGRLSRDRKPGAAMPCEIEVDKAELAVLCEVDQRSINRELEVWSLRGMAIVSHLAGSRALIRFVFLAQTIGGRKYAGWSAIAQVSYREWQEQQEKKRAESQAKEAQPAELPKEINVKAGHRTRSIPLGCDVRSLRIHLEDKTFDLALRPVIESGELQLTVWRPANETARSTQNADVTKQTSSESEVGRICPQNRAVPSNVGNNDTRKSSKCQATVDTPALQHPRAIELSQLFDPLIYRHCNKTLSGDFQSLLKACEAIADTPHDDLVKAAIERGARPIRRSSDAIAICKEIHHNWQAGKSMPLNRAVRNTRLEPKPATAEEQREALEWIAANDPDPAARKDAKRRLSK